MREARRDVPWSFGRVAARRRYADYMSSPAWWERRRRWADQWHGSFGIDPVCLVCDRPWALGAGDLHHRTYARLGAERFEDLVPLCRDCHTLLHHVLETAPAWRYMGRAAATAGIIATLRRVRQDTRNEKEERQ